MMAAPPPEEETAAPPHAALTTHIAALRRDLTGRLDDALAPARVDDLAHQLDLA